MTYDIKKYFSILNFSKISLEVTFVLIYKTLIVRSSGKCDNIFCIEISFVFVTQSSIVFPKPSPDCSGILFLFRLKAKKDTAESRK